MNLQVISGKLKLILILISISCCGKAQKFNERYFQERECARLGGKMEVVLSDRSRCDCLTDDHAIEFDFAGKWEAVEQALNYGRLTGKKPGIVFICRKKGDKGDKRKIARTRKNIEYYNLPIQVWTTNCKF